MVCTCHQKKGHHFYWEISRKWEKMKLDIRKKKPKVRRKKVSFKISREQIQCLKALEEWLASHEEVAGELPWATHLAEKIASEIDSRKQLETGGFSDMEFVLPIELVERMKESDLDFCKKGYLPDWDGYARRCIDLLIRNYTRQLELIIGQEAPPELIRYRRKTRKRSTKIPRKDPSLTSGVIDEPR